MSELAELLQSRGGRLALKLAGVVVVLALVVTAGWLWPSRLQRSVTCISWLCAR